MVEGGFHTPPEFRRQIASGNFPSVYYIYNPRCILSPTKKNLETQMAFNILSFITLEYINQTSHFLQLPKTFAGTGSHMTLEFLVSGHNAPASKKSLLVYYDYYYYKISGDLSSVR